MTILKNKNKKFYPKGFTLVEVIFAVGILATILTAALLTFIKCDIFLSDLKDRSIAIQVLKEEMESIRGMSFDAMTNLGSTFSTTGFSQLNNPQGSISIEDSFNSNDIRKVHISLNWDSLQGRNFSLSQTTLVTREGINRQ